MEIVDKKENGILYLMLKGKIMGGPEAESFREILYEAIKEDLVKVVVDMSEASWMNSSGLGMLIGGLTTLRSSGGDMILVGVNERTRRPLEITRLDAVFQMFDSKQEAIHSFK